MQTWYYHAIHTANGLEVTVHTNTQSYPLPHVAKHSPTGFEMGYGGSGPADLALSILIHYFRCFKNSPDVARSLAEPLYQNFKWEFVASAGNELKVTSEQIKAWLTDEIGPDDIENLVGGMDFDAVVAYARGHELEFDDINTWLDDMWPEKESELRVQVSDHMMTWLGAEKAGQV